MILAAAVKFFIEKTQEEVILCGCRHGEIFAQLKTLGFEPRKGYREIEQGFLTTDRKFLNREQAFWHAKETGQLSSTVYHDRIGASASPELFSEDLW